MTTTLTPQYKRAVVLNRMTMDDFAALPEWEAFGGFPGRTLEEAKARAPKPDHPDILRRNKLRRLQSMWEEELLKVESTIEALDIGPGLLGRGTAAFLESELGAARLREKQLKAALAGINDRVEDLFEDHPWWKGTIGPHICNRFFEVSRRGDRYNVWGGGSRRDSFVSWQAVLAHYIVRREKWEEILGR